MDKIDLEKFSNYDAWKRKSASENTPVDFEEAIEMTGCGKFHLAVLLTSGLCLAGVITESLGMSFVLPSADCDLEMSLNEKGLLSASAFLGLVLSAHTWGFLADIKGRRCVIKWSLGLSVVCSWISSFSHEPWLLILMRFCTGFLISGASSTAYAYLGEFHGDKTRARAISWGASFISIGMVCLPAMAWAVIPLTFELWIPGINIHYNSWRVYIILCSLPSLLSFSVIVFLPETPKFLLARGQVDETLDVLARMYVSNKGGVKSDYPVKALNKFETDCNAAAGSLKEIASLMLRQTLPLFRSPLLKYTVLVCLVQFGIFATSSGTFMWFPVIANDLMLYYAKFGENTDFCTAFRSRSVLIDLSENNDDKCVTSVNPDVFQLTLILGACFSSLYILIGMVINILGNKNILIFLLSLSGCASLVIFFVSDYTLLVILFGILMSCGVCAGVLNTIVVDLFPTHYRAMALCLSMMIGRLGASAGSNAIGHMMQYWCSGTFFVCGGILILSAALTVFIPRRNPNQEKNVLQQTPSVES